MNAHDVLRYSLNSNHDVLKKYLADLTDADLLVRPVPKANHIAWQLGHLIAAEGKFLAPKIPGLAPTELPPGFAEQHSKDTAMADPPQGFLPKAEYLDLYDKVRSNTLAALERLSDTELDQPTGIIFAPTVGTLFSMFANHESMHAAQFTVVRRLLGKPVLF